MNDDELTRSRRMLNDCLSRIEKVERENRIFKKLHVVILVILTLGILLGATPHGLRTIEAERFVLKDSKGKQRAVLHVTEEGGPAMLFFDANEKTRAYLGLSCPKCDDFSGLLFYDDKEEVRVSLMTDVTGSSYLTFRNTDGRIHAQLGINADGSPFQKLTDKNGKLVWQKP